ncbi:hypothetical protein [Sphingosinicella sp. BN140058]|uniref:hypothetical protein n=1 Tax=Sphingosinicella sp. BN140058 TaxID=1892855 RepID=UPI001012FE99|nr:hypothetical protein [Sphingosinicella sp. BN140058]QAY76644.1 hypothetical protein ETR14_09145 [Sphingosinicella sp. BN140058]
MFRTMIAAFLLAAPCGAALAQNEEMGDWALAAMPNGCMVQATSPQGTMLSVWGFAGEEKLAFLLQNREWDALRDGDNYDLKLDFLGVRTLPVEAIARREIDQDGPGLFFTLEPGGNAGNGFLDAFSTADGMRIRQDGESVDTLPLEGGRVAMTALARCLADRWAEGSVAAVAPTDEEEASPAGLTI